MRSFRVIVSGNQYLVEVGDLDQSPVSIRVNGRSYEVEVTWQGSESRATVTPDIAPRRPPREPTRPQERPPALPASPGFAEPGPSAEFLIKAPMPGTLLEVVVAPGQHVEPGDEVCTLEAMKMRNSIKAPRAGRVVEVFVQPGTKVAHGDGLVRLGTLDEPAGGTSPH